MLLLTELRSPDLLGIRSGVNCPGTAVTDSWGGEDGQTGVSCDLKEDFGPPNPTSVQWPVCAWVLSRLSCVLLFATPWTVAPQAPLSMGFPRQDTEVGCHAHLQGVFPTQGSTPHLLHLLNRQAGSLALSHLGSPRWVVTGGHLFVGGPRFFLAVLNWFGNHNFFLWEWEQWEETVL